MHFTNVLLKLLFQEILQYGTSYVRYYCPNQSEQHMRCPFTVRTNFTEYQIVKALLRNVCMSRKSLKVYPKRLVQIKLYAMDTMYK